MPFRQSRRPPPCRRTARWIIQYKEPSYYEPRHYLLLERMKQRRVLEEYSQFLSPLRLKDTLVISMESCGTVNSWFSPRDKKKGTPPQVTICWEWLDMIENGAAVPHDILPPNLKKYDGAGLLPGVTRSEAILGGVADVLLHETGHAIFDIQGIPRLGREEDAADQMSGLMVLQFGTELARTMVKGAAAVNNHLDKIGNFDPSAMADPHALDIQRLWNGVCLAYGKDAAAFKDVADLAEAAGGPPAELQVRIRPGCARVQSHRDAGYRRGADGEGARDADPAAGGFEIVTRPERLRRFQQAREGARDQQANNSGGCRGRRLRRHRRGLRPRATLSHQADQDDPAVHGRFAQ